jgi:natural product precursor
MKQLKKISLRKVSDVLNDYEMKQVLGGAPYADGGGTGSGTCGWVGGGWYECAVSKSEAMAQATSHGGRWCCDSCTPQHCHPSVDR